MINLAKDFYRLCSAKTTLSRKSVILNFAVLALLSAGYRGRDIKKIQIDSEIWTAFYPIICAYIRYIKPKYLLDTYLVKYVATGWLDQKWVDYHKIAFTEECKRKINFEVEKTIQSVAEFISNKFHGVDYGAAHQWLQIQQYGPAAMALSLKELQDCLIVELGAGIGGNAAVHSKISKQGVFIYDLPPMHEIQKEVIGRAEYFDDPAELTKAAQGKKYIVLSYWAFTEFPESLRIQFDDLIKGAEKSLFACNNIFEGVDNLKYLTNAADRLDKQITIRPAEWSSMKHQYVLLS